MTMKPLTLHLQLSAFEKLHTLADGRGRLAEVEKKHLRLLLSDHSLILGRLQDAGVNIEESDGNRRKVRPKIGA